MSFSEKTKTMQEADTDRLRSLAALAEATRHFHDWADAQSIQHAIASEVGK